MLMTIIISFISLVLNNYLLLYMPYQINDLSLFTPMFYIVSLVLICPYFNNDKTKYYTFAFLYGLIFDITTSDTLFLNAFVFLIIAILIKNLRLLLMNNIINNIIMVTISIILFDTIVFTLLSILSYINYDITYLIYKISHSLILNIIYTIILYNLLNFISQKYNIRKID